MRLQTVETENDRLKGDVLQLKNDNDRLRMVGVLFGFILHMFVSCQFIFNSLPNDKILDLSKFKAFADDKIIVTQN